MGIYQRLNEQANEGLCVRVAVVGAGFMGRGLVHRLARTPGMTPALVVNRTVEHASDAFAQAGLDQPLVSDDPAALEAAIADGRPAVASDPGLLPTLGGIDVVVEATGAMAQGAETILGALRAGRDVVTLNAEVDALLGHLLHDVAARHDAIYTIADGDQPGVLLRQIEHVAGMGFEITAAVNCKRNLDVYQDPTDSRAYATRDGTSVLMTTAFGDGTKMQIENACVANLTGLVPDVRGMHGPRTTLERALADLTGALSRTGVVEFTLGGDFGGGVFVIGRSEDAEMVHPYMRYSKMGDGPDYLFFRPYHLLHFEVPRTIAEVTLDRRPLARPLPRPVAEVVAVAKRDLAPGDALDGIGGYAAYGHIDTVERAAGLLPIGLAEGGRVTQRIAQDEPIPVDAVEFDQPPPLMEMRDEQDRLVAAGLAAEGSRGV